jgi:hypothetical protein
MVACVEPCLQVLVQDVPLDSYISMGRFLEHFRPQACILMVGRETCTAQQYACAELAAQRAAGTREQCRRLDM